jgi:hypothetical protein
MAAAGCILRNCQILLRCLQHEQPLMEPSVRAQELDEHRNSTLATSRNIVENIKNMRPHAPESGLCGHTWCAYVARAREASVALTLVGSHTRRVHIAGPRRIAHGDARPVRACGKPLPALARPSDTLLVRWADDTLARCGAGCPLYTPLPQTPHTQVPHMPLHSLLHFLQCYMCEAKGYILGRHVSPLPKKPSLHAQMLGATHVAFLSHGTCSHTVKACARDITDDGLTGMTSAGKAGNTGPRATRL